MQLQDILKESNHVKNINDLLEHFDLVIEIAKVDVNIIAKSQNIFFTDFEFTYSEAVKMLKQQLSKKHLQGIKKFLECKNIENAMQWLISRILNNMRNLTTNGKYKLYCNPSIVEIKEEIFDDHDDYEKMINDIELHKLDKTIIKDGLKKMWLESLYDEEFDYIDFTELCSKFGFEVSEIFEIATINLQKYRKEQALNCSSQLAIVF